MNNIINFPNTNNIKMTFFVADSHISPTSCQSATR